MKCKCEPPNEWLTREVRGVKLKGWGRFNDEGKWCAADHWGEHEYQLWCACGMFLHHDGIAYEGDAVIFGNTPLNELGEAFDEVLDAYTGGDAGNMAAAATGAIVNAFFKEQAK